MSVRLEPGMFGLCEFEFEDAEAVTLCGTMAEPLAGPRCIEMPACVTVRAAVHT